jgi:hypothetical protein
MNTQDTTPARPGYYAEVLAPLAVMALIALADAHLPRWCGFALDWLTILGGLAALAAWKRRAAGWVILVAAGVLCLVAAGLTLAGFMDGTLPAAALVLAAPLVAAYLWLVRVPRRADAPGPERHEVHVFHHYGADGAPVTVTAEPVCSRTVIPGVPVRSLPAARAALEPVRRRLRAVAEAINEGR